jgi:uncharacterized protein YlxW (UPF0749 family)
MVFLIVTVVMVTQMIKGIATSKSSGKHNGLAREVADLKQQLAELDSRIKNVETIVTSKDFQLEQEFESLRH